MSFDAKCKYSLKCKTFHHLKTTRYSDMGTNYSCVCDVLREDSSAGLLVEFHQHTTGSHITDSIAGRPKSKSVCVKSACSAPSNPPTVLSGALTLNEFVVVAVWSTEHHAVGNPVRKLRRRHRITGVSAVPGHRQSVLTNLITDGERRVFSRVPQTRSTLDL